MADLRWGLIGCGDISRKRVAPALRDASGSRLEAISRAQADKLDEFARDFEVPKRFADWRELVGEPDIDAVYVATPVSLHEPQTIAAAEAGKHVLCEKPMALDPAACQRMIDACGANNVKLSIAYYRRFYPVLDRMRELVGVGAIGKLALVQANAFEFFDRQPGQARRWIIEREQSGGGPMMDFGSHRAELFHHFFGPVEQARGVMDRVLFDHREVEDTSVALFKLAGGARGVLTVTHAAAEGQDTLSLYGSEGSLHSPVLNVGELHIRTKEGERVESWPPHANLHQPLVEDFIVAITENREPAVSGEDGLAAQRIMVEIYRE